MSLISLDKQYIWHPFTQMKGARITPIVRGEGVLNRSGQNPFREHSK